MISRGKQKYVEFREGNAKVESMINNVRTDLYNRSHEVVRKTTGDGQETR